MSDLSEKIELATTDREEGRDLLTLVYEMRPAFAAALPRGMSEDRFVRVALTTLRTNPRLLECSQQSVLGGFLQAAQLGLEVSDVRGQCYLIPRRNRQTGTTEATFQLGYRGMIDLAGRGGITVDPHDVTAEDEFDFRYGTESYLHHTPAWREKRSEPIAFYAVARFADGREPEFAVMGLPEMEEHRERFRSDSRSSSPWDQHFAAMGRKTVVRRLLNYLPLPVEASTGISADDRTVEADPVAVKKNPERAQLEVSEPDTDEEGDTEGSRR